MAAIAHAAPRMPHWYMVPIRAFLITFAFTLMSFAISLFLGISGVAIAAALRGIHPNMTLAYRKVALPIAVVVGLVVFI